MPTPRQLRGRKGAAVRHGDFDKAIAIGRELEVENLAQHAQRVADAAPPLTPEQVDRVVSILRPSKPVDGYAARILAAYGKPAAVSE